MQDNEIHIGTAYTCKVGRNTIRVTVTEALPDGGWTAETHTGRSMTIRSADRFIEAADAPEEAAPPAEMPEAEPTTETGTERPTVAEGAATGATGDTVGTMSLLDAAALLLGQASEPMRCSDLVEKARESGLWAPKRGGKTPDRTLYSAILREINTKGDTARFRKVERGQFALNG